MAETTHSLNFIEEDAVTFASQLSDPQESADEGRIVQQAFKRMKQGDIDGAYADAIKDSTVYYVRSQHPVGWVLKSILVQYVRVLTGVESGKQESAA